MFSSWAFTYVSSCWTLPSFLKMNRGWIFPKVLWRVNHSASETKNLAGKGNPLLLILEQRSQADAQTRGVWRRKSRAQSFPISCFFQPISHEVLVSWKETLAGKTRCFYESLMHSHPPLTQRDFKSIIAVNSGHDAAKHPTNQSSNRTFTPKWYLGIKGCRMMQELLHWMWGSKGTE